jgi:hypothetical protein
MVLEVKGKGQAVCENIRLVPLAQGYVVSFKEKQLFQNSQRAVRVAMYSMQKRRKELKKNCISQTLWITHP